MPCYFVRHLCRAFLIGVPPRVEKQHLLATKFAFFYEYMKDGELFIFLIGRCERTSDAVCTESIESFPADT